MDDVNDYLSRPVFARFTDTVATKAPRESVLYWNDVSRLVLNLLIAMATLLYILRGGKLLRLAPTS